MAALCFSVTDFAAAIVAEIITYRMLLSCDDGVTRAWILWGKAKQKQSREGRWLHVGERWLHVGERWCEVQKKERGNCTFWILRTEEAMTTFF